MAVKILMPALSPTMTEGNLVKWNKKEGDKVAAGDVIAEIETDKATMEVEAVDEGILAKIVIPEGTENVKVNELIAVLKEEGDDEAAVAALVSAGGGIAAPVAKAEEKPAPVAAAPSAPMVAHTTADRVKASPLAKRVAEQEGVNLKSVQGSGPNGRIVRADVLASKSGKGGRSFASAPMDLSRDDYGMPAFEALKNSNVRKVIAKRLSESKQQVPHFYLTLDCELDALLDARKHINGHGKDAYKISVNDMIIKASAMALRDVPAANASWAEDAIRQYNTVDISVAVAIDGGLITPIIRSAEKKHLIEISGEMKALADKARAGKLQPTEFTGGTFSISNLGMFGIKDFAAIVNPPQGAILAVGAGEERAVVKHGQLAVANVMSVTLSVDHRVVDGAVGAQFLGAFKKYIESPGLLFV